jgi:hypothetical protein
VGTFVEHKRAPSLRLINLKTLGVVQRAVNCDAAAVTAEELIELATLGSARAVRQGSDIGRLAPGYKADIVLVDTRRPHLTPSSSIPAMLVWQASGRNVRTVLSDGRVVMRDGIVDWLDENAEADLPGTASNAQRRSPLARVFRQRALGRAEPSDPTISDHVISGVGCRRPDKRIGRVAWLPR